MNATIKGPVTTAIQQIWTSFFQAAQDYNGRKRSYKSKPEPEVKIKRLSKAQIDRHLHPKQKPMMKYHRIITNPEDSDDLPDFSSPDDSESEKENDHKVPNTETTLANFSGNSVSNGQSNKLNEIKPIADNSIQPANNKPKKLSKMIDEKAQKYLQSRYGNFQNEKISEISLSKITSVNEIEYNEPTHKKFKVDKTDYQHSPKLINKDHEAATAIQVTDSSIVKQTKAITSIPNKVSKVIEIPSIVDKSTMTSVIAKATVNVGVNTDNSVQSKCIHNLNDSSLLLHMKLNDVLFSKTDPIAKDMLQLTTDKEVQTVVTHIKSIIERLDLHKKAAGEEFNALKGKYENKMKEIEAYLEQLYNLRIELLKGRENLIADPVSSLKNVQLKVTDFFEPAFQNIQLSSSELQQPQSNDDSAIANGTAKCKIMEGNTTTNPLLSELFTNKSTKMSSSLNSGKVDSPSFHNSGALAKHLGNSNLNPTVSRSTFGPAKDIPTTVMATNAFSQPIVLQNQSSISAAIKKAFVDPPPYSITQIAEKRLANSNKSPTVSRPAIGHTKDVPTTIMSKPAHSQPSALQNQGSVSAVNKMHFVPKYSTTQNAAKHLGNSNLNPTVSRSTFGPAKDIPTTVMATNAFSQPIVLQHQSSISAAIKKTFVDLPPYSITQIAEKRLANSNKSPTVSRPAIGHTKDVPTTVMSKPAHSQPSALQNQGSVSAVNKMPFVPQYSTTQNAATNQLFQNSGALLMSDSRFSNIQPPLQAQKQLYPCPPAASTPQKIVATRPARISVQSLEKLQAKSVEKLQGLPTNHPQYSNSLSLFSSGQGSFQGVPPTWVNTPITAPSNQMGTPQLQFPSTIVQSSLTNTPRFAIHVPSGAPFNVNVSPNIQHGGFHSPQFTCHYPGSIAPSIQVGNFSQTGNSIGGNVQGNASLFIQQQPIQTVKATSTDSSKNNQIYTTASSDDDVQEITTCFLCGKDSTITCCGSFVYCSMECKDEDFERHQQECTARRMY